jgi:hypothetical protein
MSDKNTHSIDDIFSKGMNALPEEAPSLAGWEKLKAEMKKEGIKMEEEKKTNKVLWLSIFSSILIATGCFTYYYMGKNSTVEEPSKEIINAETKGNENAVNAITSSNTNAVNADNVEEEHNNTTETSSETETKSLPAKETSAVVAIAKPEKDVAKNKKTSMLSVYSIRVASFSGKVEDPELNAIPNLKSEYNANEDATTFFIGGFKSKEEAITGMKRIQREFNSRIDPNDAASQKNLKDAYILFEEELGKL